MIVQVSVVLKGTVGDSDGRFDNLSGSHLQSQDDYIAQVVETTVAVTNSTVLFRTILTWTITLDKL